MCEKKIKISIKTLEKLNSIISNQDDEVRFYIFWELK
jgi:hypothetical protein